VTPHVRAALRELPARPGVYIFRSRTGRPLYIGRAGDLRRRVRSYWSEGEARPGDRRRTAAGTAWIDPIICASEHEAAMLERNLLEASAPRANRIEGTESALLLEVQPARRRVVAVHPEDAVLGIRSGPYLGGTLTRAAADALNGLFPLDAVGADAVPLSRELARARGRSLPVHLERELRAVLAGDRRAVEGAIALLEARRDSSAAVLRFEHAASVQRHLVAIRWISATQRARRMDDIDADGIASDGHGHVHVVVRMRAGRVVERRWSASRRPRLSADRSAALSDMARENAELLAAFVAAGAVPVSRLGADAHPSVTLSR